MLPNLYYPHSVLSLGAGDLRQVSWGLTPCVYSEPLAKDTHNEFPQNTLFSGYFPENSSPLRNLELSELHLFSSKTLLPLRIHLPVPWQESIPKKKSRATVRFILYVFPYLKDQSYAACYSVPGNSCLIYLSYFRVVFRGRLPPVITGSRNIIAIFRYFFLKKSQNLTFPLNKNTYLHEQFIVVLAALVSQCGQLSQ